MKRYIWLTIMGVGVIALNVAAANAQPRVRVQALALHDRECVRECRGDLNDCLEGAADDLAECGAPCADERAAAREKCVAAEELHLDGQAAGRRAVS